MSNFDPYHVWLGIPPSEQPPHHYRLLGLQLFESSPEVIESAADRQMSHLRTFQTGPHGVDSQRLLNEVSKAKICLLNPSQKQAYDAQLRTRLTPAPAAPAQFVPAPIPAARAVHAAPASHPLPLQTPAPSPQIVQAVRSGIPSPQAVTPSRDKSKKAWPRATWWLWGAGTIAAVVLIGTLNNRNGNQPPPIAARPAETQPQPNPPDALQPEPEFLSEDLATSLDVYSETLMNAPESIDMSRPAVARTAAEDRRGSLALAPWPSFGDRSGLDFRVLEGDLVATDAGVATSFGSRGAAARKAMTAVYGGTKQSEQAVAAGLNWIARHQNPNNSWSIEKFSGRCKGSACSGQGSAKSDTAATALALLPFLATGQTHETKGLYQKNIAGGLYWLIQNQDSSGNLAKGSTSLMYSHGMASIALCEAYGMSRDRSLGAAAQNALKFIDSAQDKAGGGWRYTPGQAGDTSVVGWQVMALKSGQMAGLNVNSSTLEGAKKFLNSCAKGNNKGTFSYMPASGPTPATSAIGLLCRQHMGMSREDGAMTEGMGYLMRNIAKPATKNSYYWYYATQVMHNLPGAEWDQWNRTMRRILIDSQEKEGCAAGSWNPEGHSHGEAGGRMMVTSLSLLTLQVYYRYSPVYASDTSR